MAKKKSQRPQTATEFDNNPFKTLKGFAASETQETDEPKPENTPVATSHAETSFEKEMDSLGVQPLVRDAESEPPPTPNHPPAAPLEPQTDEQLFLASLGEIDVCFSDSLPDEPVVAQPRRMKKLRQGRLKPEASLDLHGLQRHEVGEKLEYFLRKARHNNWQTLLIVTGRGLHSVEGLPILRNEVERLLRETTKERIAEWGRAPRQYGGDGAIVIFLRSTKETGSHGHGIED